MSFDPSKEGFLWPQETELTNAYDETMTVRPSAIRVGFESADDQGKMALRMYATGRGEMTEVELAQWMCGGPIPMMRILERIHDFMGDNKPVTLGELRRRMSEIGVSEAALTVVLRRLLAGGYVQREGAGAGETVNIVKW